MFKKEPHVKALSNLKNSERKKLLQTCKEQTGCSEYSFLSPVVKQTNYKGQHSSGTVYTDENNVPIWFKEKHGELLFPTVYSCWSFPELLPIVLTHEFVIEEKIFNGANLMLAGTVPPFDPRCVPATVCGIASKENPTVVLAIGVVQLNLPSYDSVIGQQGVAVQVMHYLTDGLCQTFKVDLEPPRAPEDDTKATEVAEEPELERDTSRTTVRVEDVAEVLDELSVEDVDNFFTRALYYTLTQDSNLELPITASKFISAHVLPNLPLVDPAVVNMKKTSWKKTAKYLKHFEKAGFLQLKGKGDDLVIVGVDKGKDELKSFVPYKTTADNSPRKGNAETTHSPDVMYSEKYYKPINLGKDFVQCTSLPPKLLYTVPDLRDSLNEYIATHKLVDTRNKKMVLLDDLLYDMINKKKKSQDVPRCVSRAQILEPFLANNFTEFFQIFKDETPLFKSPVKGSLPHVKIVTEMKIGRKVVTRVSNFEIFKINTDELAADLRKLCSGSTTVGETLTSPKTAEVQVQGAHGNLIIEHLNSKGIPSKWIDFESKLKSKKKRPAAS